jgi:hypothetical protein
MCLRIWWNTEEVLRPQIWSLAEIKALEAKAILQAPTLYGIAGTAFFTVSMYAVSCNAEPLERMFPPHNPAIYVTMQEAKA